MKLSRSFALCAALILAPFHGAESAVRRNARGTQEQWDDIPPRANAEKKKENQKIRENPETVCEREPDPIKDPITNPETPMRPNKIKPFCATFGTPRTSSLEGFSKCPGAYDNIVVSTATPGQNGATDSFLQLKDLSGGSLACGQGNFVGDWTDLASPGCNKLCFDMKVIEDGCKNWVSQCVQDKPGDPYYMVVLPRFILQGGPPNYYRAVFTGLTKITDDQGPNPGWHKTCAPLALLDSAGNLPSNSDGAWTMGRYPCDTLGGSVCSSSNPIAPNSAWNDLLSDVTAVNLVVDINSNQDEVFAYDNICIEEHDCHHECNPQPLCHWMYKWDCKILDHDKYSEKFHGLLKKLEISTFSRNVCVCKILDQCCPDRCDMAKQEFLALLLNVAFGYIDLECCVFDGCRKDKTVQDVIVEVERLLAQYPSTENVCARAMALASDINEGAVFCENNEDGAD